jgi:hypothetical protein
MEIIYLVNISDFKTVNHFKRNPWSSCDKGSTALQLQTGQHTAGTHQCWYCFLQLSIFWASIFSLDKVFKLSINYVFLFSLNRTGPLMQQDCYPVWSSKLQPNFWRVQLPATAIAYCSVVMGPSPRLQKHQPIPFPWAHLFFQVISKF